MRIACRRRFAAALLVAIAIGPATRPAGAQEQRIPVPTAAPQTPAEAPAADRPPAAPGEALPGPAEPPAEVPVPEARPEPDAGPDAAPAQSPAAKAPPAASPPGEEQAPGPSAPPAPEAGGAPAGPQPAYVSPETARTTPEPTAPQTPAMEVTPAETVEAAAAVEDAGLCEAELTKRGAVFTVGETIAEGDCGVLRPVNLTTLSSGATIAPGTQFLCRTALALDIWMGDSVAPAAKAELGGAKVATISQASTYVCRARASESKISEHSRGSAIDIAALTLSDGRSLTVEAQAPGSPEDRFTAAIRRGACGPFKTVLGPGTDSDHGTHLHLDIAARANGSLYCR